MSAPAEASGFARVMTLEEAHRQNTRLAYVASEAERAAIARHFGWTHVARLEADLDYAGTGDEIGVAGQLRAEVTQPCVVTMQPVHETIDAGFAVRLVPAQQLDGEDEDEERELDAEALDTIGYRDGRFDVGAIIAETLALSVNPWPRASDADAWLANHGGSDDGPTGPFAALAALRGKTERD